ncbi:unnamed protein product [Calypogeia fissa]
MLQWWIVFNDIQRILTGWSFLRELTLDCASERRTYNWWESEGYDYFKPNMEKDETRFVMGMPPPNVSEALHFGHAMFGTLEEEWGNPSMG